MARKKPTVAVRLGRSGVLGPIYDALAQAGVPAHRMPAGMVIIQWLMSDVDPDRLAAWIEAYLHTLTRDV